MGSADDTVYKPVRQGLDALAHGSLVQNYALAVAVARLVESPVEHAVLALAAADVKRGDDPSIGLALHGGGFAAAH